jgi:hypothetical protein
MTLFTHYNHLYNLSALMSEVARFSVRPTHFNQPTWHRVPEGSQLQISPRIYIVLFVVCNPLNMPVFPLFFTTDQLPVLTSRLSALLYMNILLPTRKSNTMTCFTIIICTHCNIASPTHSHLSQPKVSLLGHFGQSSTTVL